MSLKKEKTFTFTIKVEVNNWNDLLGKYDDEMLVVHHDKILDLIYSGLQRYNPKIEKTNVVW